MEVRMGLGRFSDGSEVRIHVPVQETRVRALIQEDPTSRAAIKSVLRNKGCHPSKKPARQQLESSPR